MAEREIDSIWCCWLAGERVGGTFEHLRVFCGPASSEEELPSRRQRCHKWL